MKRREREGEKREVDGEKKRRGRLGFLCTTEVRTHFVSCKSSIVN